MSKKYAPIDWDEIRSKKVELPKFKTAKERSDFVAAMYKDADMMIDDEKILRNERTSIQVAERMADPEFRSVWDEKQKVGSQKRSDNAEWQENVRLGAQKRVDDPRYWKNHQLAMEKLHNDPGWQESHQLQLEKMHNNPKWQESVTKSNRLKAQDPVWLENNRLGAQKRVNDPVWLENNRLGAQKRVNDPVWQAAQQSRNKKTFSKLISCDGVSYPSKKEAALVLAPSNRTTDHSKIRWFTNQMIKYPDRFFYVDKE